MDESRVEPLKIRPDLIGNYERSNQLQGYKAERFLCRLLKENEEHLLEFISKKWGFNKYVKTISYEYKVKYARYLKDKEARKYIYEKYGDRQSIVDILCCRVTDLDANECIRLKQIYENTSLDYSLAPSFEVVQEIVKNFKSELKLLIPDDTEEN